jgi:hypothetical protein
MAAVGFPGGPVPQGSTSYLNITAATVVKLTPGVAVTAVVVVAGSAAGAVYDATTTTGNSATNQVGVLPTTAGTVALNALCAAGIVVAPGTGQTIALFYD